MHAYNKLAAHIKFPILNCSGFSIGNEATVPLTTTQWLFCLRPTKSMLSLHLPFTVHLCVCVLSLTKKRHQCPLWRHCGPNSPNCFLAHTVWKWDQAKEAKDEPSSPLDHWSTGEIIVRKMFLRLTLFVLLPLNSSRSLDSLQISSHSPATCFLHSCSALYGSLEESQI